MLPGEIQVSHLDIILTFLGGGPKIKLTFCSFTAKKTNLLFGARGPKFKLTFWGRGPNFLFPRRKLARARW